MNQHTMITKILIALLITIVLSVCSCLVMVSFAIVKWLHAKETEIHQSTIRERSRWNEEMITGRKP